MSPSPETFPEQIGPYRLIEAIGEGGMGVVLKAEQTGAIRRTVALKLIKAGMDSKQVIARFEAERQALAMMDHPGIAAVHDAGTTDEGRPYFVMEFVNGRPITDFCADHQLPLNQRLRLFSVVCEAVQHAHQKGIIHRDLKPCNILVVENDQGTPIPKVIDFGIAKATQTPLTEQTLVTNFSQVMGSPAYMSPEQADLSGMDVDTRTDIYALGVLLYELVTGHLPIERERFASAAFAEIQRLLWEEEPPRPSKRLTSIGPTINSISAAQSTTPAKLLESIEGDLDWIIMRAIDKDRTRRYASANGFAEDLERFLNYEPVTATPPSAGYLLRKFVKRHRSGVITTAVVGCLLVATTAFSVRQAIRATHAESNADEQRITAEATLAFLQDDLLMQASPTSQPDRDIRLRTVVDQAAHRLEDRFHDQPLIKISLFETLAKLHNKLGNGDEAERLIRNALALADKHLPGDSPRRLTLEHELGSTYSARSQYAKALAIYEEVLDSRIRILGPSHRDTIQTKLGCCFMLIYMRNEQRSVEMARELHQETTLNFGEDDSLTQDALRSLIQALSLVAKDFDQALPYLDDVIAKLDRDKDSWDDPIAIQFRGDRAYIHIALGNLEQAVVDYERVLAADLRLYGPDHKDVATTKSNLATVFMKLNRYEKALPLLEEAYDGYLKVRGERNPWTMQVLRNLAEAHLHHGEREEGLRRARELLTRCHRSFGNSFHQTLWAYETLRKDLEERGLSRELEALLEEMSGEVPWNSELTETLVSNGSRWHYQTTRPNEAKSWRQLDFDDSTWKIGASPFGFGESEIVTSLDTPSPEDRPVTVYFRQHFEITDPNQWHQLKVRVRRDDSVALFLNGKEVVRHYLPSDAETTHETLSTEPVLQFGESLYYVSVLDADLLLSGTNVLAAEVHQHKPDSSDLFFDLALEGLRNP